MNYEPMVSSSRPSAVYPGDKKPGCLPRKTQFGKVFAPASEKIKVIPKEDWDAIAKQMPNGVKLFVNTILDQDGVGSCAAEATTQAVMIARAFAGLPHVVLNPWFLYYHTSGGVDRGSSIDENLETVLKYGIAPMDVWPRSKGWRTKPSDEAYEAAKEFSNVEVFDVATINEMVSGLLLPAPIVYGSSGHAVVKVRHIDDSKGEDANSWSLDWGDKGYGVWASYRAVDFGYGAFGVRAYR